MTESEDSNDKPEGLMELVFSEAGIEIWRDRRAGEFYVYSRDRLVRVCPSIGMAHEVAAGAA